MTDTEATIADELTPDAELTPDDDAQPGDLAAGTQPDEQPADPGPLPMSQTDVEKRLSALDKEAQRHEKRVAEIMGDDFALLIPSPVDWTPGYIFNPQMMPPPDEAVQALDALLGRGGADLHDDPTKERCELCGGRGMLRTGSLVANQDALPCGPCQGKGWTPTASAAAAAPQPMLTVVGPGGAPQQMPTGPVAADRWGRPFGHPHYNLDPASVGL